jgi:hypothetical protein
MSALVGTGIKVDETTTTAKFKLGELRFTEDGRGWVYIQADEAVEQYDACVIHSDWGVSEATDTTAAVGTGSGKMICVPQVAIASGSYGWGCVRSNGDATVNADALCAAYTQLYTSATGGVLSDTADNDVTVSGIVLTATLATGASSGTAVMNFPHVFVDLII